MPLVGAPFEEFTAKRISNYAYHGYATHTLAMGSEADLAEETGVAGSYFDVDEPHT